MESISIETLLHDNVETCERIAVYIWASSDSRKGSILIYYIYFPHHYYPITNIRLSE